MYMYMHCTLFVYRASSKIISMGETRAISFVLHNAPVTDGVLIAIGYGQYTVIGRWLLAICAPGGTGTFVGGAIDN